MVNNPEGNNQHGAKDYPSDDVLRPALLRCISWKYSQKKKLDYLEREFGLKIKRTSLFHLEKRLNIPSVRKPRLPQEEIDKIVVDFIAKDKAKRNGPNAIKSMLQDELIMVPRDRLRAIMRAIAPEGFELRLPGKKKKLLVRVALFSFGPFHEISADGHEKLNSQALRMGDISLPIYAYRDKWSGYILKIQLLPDTRKSAAIGHLYLDLVEEYGGVPIQLTTDKGSEIGWQCAIQDSLRRLMAPDLDPDQYPTSVGLKSVHNTVIESLWGWLQRTTGMNLKDAILEGKEMHYYHPHCSYHTDLFYWVFVPVIQRELDRFRTYWNNHQVRPQKEKLMPSGHVPSDAFENPKNHDPEAEKYLIKVPDSVLTDCRRYLTDEVGERSAHMSWYSEEFAASAQDAYVALGSPEITLENAWEVFNSMSAVLRDSM
ncbi:hypothetical protein NMY22_g19640 [Coprinellus aureogranulatus]|nr:hypothetical protein NMY22_g19640 [Coprinellus aureogranulatus]